VRSVGVVGPCELVDRGLGGGPRPERLVIIEQFPAQREVEAFDLAGRGRRRRLGQPVGDPVVPADLVEQHLTALAEPAGELLAVVGQDLLRHPEPRQRAGQRHLRQHNKSHSPASRADDVHEHRPQGGADHGQV